MKAKVKNLIARIHKDWWKIAQIFLWIFLFVKYKGVRDFFLGMFKMVTSIWIWAIILVIAMSLFALISVLVMVIGVKIGVLPEDYIAVKLNKRHKDREQTTMQD